jgi:hypothetical protein
MMWCLALALGAAIAVTVAVTELRTARRGLDQAQAEARLEAAHTVAATTVLSDGLPGRLAWTITVDRAAIDILAEPETEKRGWRAAADDFQAVEILLAPADPAKAKAALAALADDPDAGSEAVSLLDASPRWRACAASVLSRFGAGDRPALSLPRLPRPRSPAWRIGQAWRIRATQGGGWTETRVVRFTGDAEHPWAVMERRLTRRPQDGPSCAT